MFSSRSYEGALEAAYQQANLLDSINTRALDKGLGTMDKIQAHDEDTLGSGSGSGLSDLSALENETTDDFGRMLLQHQRDTRRMNSATRGSQQAFTKARPHPRIAERLTYEEGARDKENTTYHERTGSGGSNDMEPPVNVPKEWGRRARKQADWLKKITAPSENGDEDVSKSFKSEAAAIYTNDAEGRLEANEMTPPSMQRGRYTATPPSSLRHMNTTLRPLIDSEDLDSDFTSNSFFTSTPARPQYRRKIDEIARREIEELESKAVTTRALDQIDQHSPNAVLRRTSSQRLRERALADGLLSPSMSPTSPPAKSRSPSRIPVRRQSAAGNKENVPLHDNADGSVKGLPAAGRVNRTAQPLVAKQLPRPVHQRNDSMSLLRKLARVSSMSPSPAREHSGSDTIPEVKPAEIKEVAEQHPPHTEGSGPAHEIDETQPPEDLPVEAKTPVVTGAWVDTTMNLNTQTEPLLSGIVHDDHAETVAEESKQRESKPSQPKSALDAIMREAKEQPEVENYGESTIQSLEDIVHPNMDPTDTSMILNLDGKYDTHQGDDIDDGVPLTQAEKDRRQEHLAMEAMNKHLRTARSSIKDANRGLRRVENKIETASAPADPVIAAIPAAVAPRVTTQGESGRIRCEACGGGYHSVWKALWIELRSCFYTWDSNSKYRIRFTWLGLACIFWWVYYLSECTLCEIYCNPQYVSSPYDGPDPNAPEFPFVIPTLLFRPLRWLWKPVCDALAEALGVAFHALFGDTSTSPDPPPIFIPPKSGATLRKAFSHTQPTMQNEWLATATATGARVAWSVLDVVDEAGSMWDDEFLR